MQSTLHRIKDVDRALEKIDGFEKRPDYVNITAMRFVRCTLKNSEGVECKASAFQSWRVLNFCKTCNVKLVYSYPPSNTTCLHKDKDKDKGKEKEKEKETQKEQPKQEASNAV